MKPSKPLWWIAGLLFAGATVWLNYQVKVKFRPQRFGGFVKEIGDVTVGQKAPDFEVTDLEGHSVSLADYRGKRPVLIDFWATWCGPCRLSMPELQGLHHQYGDQVEFLSLDEGEPQEKVAAALSSETYSMHFALDPDTAVGNLYGVSSIPTQVLVDRTGTVVWMGVGYRPKDPQLAAALKRAAAP